MADFGTTTLGGQSPLRKPHNVQSRQSQPVHQVAGSRGGHEAFGEASDCPLEDRSAAASTASNSAQGRVRETDRTWPDAIPSSGTKQEQIFAPAKAPSALPATLPWLISQANRQPHCDGGHRPLWISHWQKGTARRYNPRFHHGFWSQTRRDAEQRLSGVASGWRTNLAPGPDVRCRPQLRPRGSKELSTLFEVWHTRNIRRTDFPRKGHRNSWPNTRRATSTCAVRGNII